LWQIIINNIDFIGLTILGSMLIGCYFILKHLKGSDIYNFEQDYEMANKKAKEQKELNIEKTFIGISPNRRDVFIPNNAKHVFVCGTTGSGKTVALSNFIKSAVDYNYPLLIVDGKGDTNEGSILEVTKLIGEDRKLYIIDLNNPSKCHRYNPFKNTSPDIIKDMLINMTTWSEEHYKYNAERYIQRLCFLLQASGITISLETITKYLYKNNFLKLSKDLSEQAKISKDEHIANIALADTSGDIAESASARFATIKESMLGQIFHEDGIDIYTALKENAIILFILNPLNYPETSPLIGNLIIIDSKKAVSNFYNERKHRIFYILDEINVYASPSLLDLVNKSRSANITCILATQSLSDLDTVNEQFKEQVIENCNNYIVLRQNSSTNAEHWSEIIGTRQTMQATYQVKGEKGVTTPTTLGTLRRTREFIYHPDDIKTLKTGEAFFVSRDEMFNTKLKIHKPF